MLEYDATKVAKHVEILAHSIFWQFFLSVKIPAINPLCFCLLQAESQGEWAKRR